MGESIGDGMYWVIDADIERYFDSIPHDRLMKVVARRVVDSSMLTLIRMFLAAPVIDERNGGGPRRPLAGVPKGGVVSPLLANLYLHLMDRNFRRRVEDGELSGRLVRYCDDFVLVTRLHPARELAWLEGLMSRLGLKLHPAKTKVVDSRKESFDFLGYRVRRRVGRLVLDISPKSVCRIHEMLREPTKRTFQSLPRLVRELNGYIRGARNYFKLAPWWSRRRLDSYVAMRIGNGFVGSATRNTRQGRSCRGTRSTAGTAYSNGLLCNLGVKTPRGRVDESGRTAGCGKSARPVG